MVEAYIPLANSVAYSRRGIVMGMRPLWDIDDVRSLSYVALIGAIEKYNPELANPVTFISQFIGLRILDAARDAGMYSRGAIHIGKKMQAARNLLRAMRGRSPSDQEVLDFLGVEDGRRSRWLECERDRNRKVMSASDPIDRRGDSTKAVRPTAFGDLLADPNAEDPADIVREMDPDEFDKLLIGVPLIQRAAFHMRYRMGMTMSACGRALGISESRISQMFDVELARLRACHARGKCHSVAA